MVNADTWVGVDYIGDRDANSHRLGYNDTVVLDASAGDAEPAATFVNCRFISVDVTGIAKIAYKDAGGVEVIEVKVLTAGVIYAIRNVVRLYQYYTGTTDGTVQAYGTDGVAIVNGIKLHR